MSPRLFTCRCGRNVFYIPCPACRRAGELLQMAKLEEKIGVLKEEVTRLKGICRTMKRTWTPPRPVKNLRMK